MEDKESRRTCRVVNYAENLGDPFDDDDFAAYTPPLKKQKENNERPVETDVNGGKSSSDRDKRKKDKKERKDHKDHTHEKYKDHRREKSRDSDRNERDKYRERHSKDREREREKKRKSRTKQDGEKKDTRHDKYRKHDSESKTYRERQDGEDHSVPRNEDLNPLKFNDHPLTSTQISPNRSTPKPRLSIEEKLFQRELEAALAVSRVETQEDPANVPKEEFQVDSEVGPLSNSMLADLNDDLNHITSPHNSPLPNHDAEQKTTSPTSSLSAKRNKSEDPQPSTSTGFTSKRQRKTVAFKEDPDSDSFDGFEEDEDLDSDFSEESDFTPSKKEKRREKRKSKNNKSPVSKATARIPVRSKDSSLKSSPTRKATKENTAPQSPLTPKVLPSTVTPQRSPTVVKTNNSVMSPKMRSRETSPVVKTSKTAGSPSGISKGSVGLVKTPFKSPLLHSPSNSCTSSSSRLSLGANPNTGLRIGLSRRANLKPLHPNMYGK